MVYPRDDPRFDVAPGDYPGGADAYWRDYDAAGLRAHREERRSALGLDEQQMADRDAYYGLKSHVHEVATRVAAEAGIDTRTLSLWLVQVKGYPWREDCSYFDLRRILRFLESTGAVAEAARLPPAAPSSRPPRPDDQH